MEAVFTRGEFMERISRVKKRMGSASVDLMLVSDPNNIFWLTGVADW